MGNDVGDAGNETVAFHFAVVQLAFCFPVAPGFRVE